jgi:hypothetical protein
MGRNKVTFCKGHKINNGRILTEEHKEKIRAGMLRAKENGAIGHPKGMTTWNKGLSNANGDSLPYGKPRTDETKRKMSDAAKGKTVSDLTKKKLSGIVKQWWKDPENAKKCLCINSPNKQELKLKNILDLMYPGEWKFVGDGQVIIDGKCPDFININGQKKIIELYGERWHKPDEPQKRINVFKPFGYDTLVIWVRELQNSRKIKTTLKQFCESNKI